MDDTRFFRRRQHGFALGEGVGEGLFAENVLPGFGRGDGHLGVKESRGGNVDGVDVIALKETPPVGLDLRPTPALREGSKAFFVAAAGDLHDGLHRRIKKSGDLIPGVRMGAPHETMSDDGDA